VFYQWNDLAGAEQEILAGLEWGHRSGDAMTLMGGYLTLARIRYHLAGFDRAAELIRQAERLRQEKELSSWGVRLAATWVWLWRQQGHLPAIDRGARTGKLNLVSTAGDDSAGYPSDLRYVRLITQARLLLAEAIGKGPGWQGKLAEALTLLTGLRQDAESADRIRWLIEILVLQAQIYQLQDDEDQAVAALAEALAPAEPAGYVRLFVDEGPPLAAVLQHPSLRQAAPDYVSKLLTAFAAEAEGMPGYQLIEPLSERELELLTYLAGGLSNQQIAEALCLSVGTVKWHLNNIYGKLGVNRRTQAVARARELGLI
jgi:LuxR family maltose regulon positive regulatory protein